MFLRGQRGGRRLQGRYNGSRNGCPSLCLVSFLEHPGFGRQGKCPQTPAYGLLPKYAGNLKPTKQTYVHLNKSLCGFFPEADGKPVLLFDKIGNSAVVSAHSWNNFVANPHASGVDVTVVTQHVD